MDRPGIRRSAWEVASRATLVYGPRMTRCCATVRGCSFALVCLLLAGCLPPPGAGDQSQAERLHNAGRSRVQQQDFKGAVAAFEQALRADPAFAKSHYELGMVFERELNSPEKALYHYIRALELDPNYQGADLISNRLATVRMQLSSSATPSFSSPQLAAEIDRLQGELKTAQEERTRLMTENTSLKEQLAIVSRQPVSVVSSNRVAQGQGTATGPVRADAGTGQTTNPPGPSLAAASRTHTIQKGDSLYGLSRRYQVSQEAIAAANPGLSARNFPIGRTVVIPAR